MPDPSLRQILAHLVAGGDPAPEVPMSALDRRITTLSANIQYTDTAMQQRHTIDSAVQLSAGITAWQEAHKQDARNYINRLQGQRTFWPGGVTASGAPKEAPDNAIPVSWLPSRWEFEDGGRDKVVVGDDTVPDAMAGVSPTRFVSWVILRDTVTGQKLARVNTHLVSGVDGFGKAPRQWRRQAHAAGIDTFIRRMRSFGDIPVIGSGDFNTTRLPTLLAGHGLQVLKPNAATHKTRIIDWYVVRDPKNVLNISLDPRVKPLGNSDHKAVWLAVDIAPSHEEPDMSGLCPFAVHKIIAPGSNDPAITPRVAILHVDAGNAESLFDFFKNRSGGIESHFHVQKDGGLEQYRSIYRQADANNDANDFAVSIETQGFGAGEWTDEQIATIKRLLTWLNKEAGIPLRKVEEWDGSGVGYHTLFGAPSRWTPVAKSCPGPDRIKQFHAVLVPWMADPKEDEVTPEDIEKIADLCAEKVRKTLLMGQDGAPKGRYVGSTLTGIYNAVQDIKKQLASKES